MLFYELDPVIKNSVVFMVKNKKTLKLERYITK